MYSLNQSCVLADRAGATADSVRTTGAACFRQSTFLREAIG
jgi:hypothetical protein